MLRSLFEIGEDDMNENLSDVELALLNELAQHKFATTLRRPLTHQERIAFNKLVDARLVTKTRYRANFPPTIGVTDRGRELAQITASSPQEDQVWHSCSHIDDAPPSQRKNPTTLKPFPSVPPTQPQF